MNPTLPEIYRQRINDSEHIHQLQPVREAIKADILLEEVERATLLGAVAEREDEIGQAYMVQTLRRDADQRRGIY